MLRGIIERGVVAKVFRCTSPERAARQLFALAMGYADDLLLQPSVEAVEAALEEVVQVAQMVLDFELGASH
jgi:ethanolamine utilization microcompartment shell protein EutS